ncbi:MAG: DUF4359 domain-containing protein [Bacteroidales bacterium]|nr:DUF4359 domain-containing protein [Bacteroidales bacterium]
MKKFLIALVAVIAIAGIAVVTCPDKQAHKDAIMSVINEKINESVSKDSTEGDEGIALFASSLGSGIVGYVIDNRLTVKNHFVFSTGELNKLDGTSERLSVGFFGHVFTFSKEDLDKAMDGII